MKNNVVKFDQELLVQNERSILEAHAALDTLDGAGRVTSGAHQVGHRTARQIRRT